MKSNRLSLCVLAATLLLGTVGASATYDPPPPPHNADQKTLEKAGYVCEKVATNMYVCDHKDKDGKKDRDEKDERTCDGTGTCDNLH
jgi:hypothetical protein